MNWAPASSAARAVSGSKTVPAPSSTRCPIRSATRWWIMQISTAAANALVTGLATNDDDAVRVTLGASHRRFIPADSVSQEDRLDFLEAWSRAHKVVITGDVTQIDLIGGLSGLRQVRNILTDVADVAFVELQARDVVRHRLVQRIVTAYHTYEEAQRSAAGSDA